MNKKGKKKACCNECKVGKKCAGGDGMYPVGKRGKGMYPVGKGLTTLPKNLNLGYKL